MFSYNKSKIGSIMYNFFDSWLPASYVNIKYSKKNWFVNNKKGSSQKIKLMILFQQIFINQFLSQILSIIFKLKKLRIKVQLSILQYSIWLRVSSFVACKMNSFVKSITDTVGSCKWWWWLLLVVILIRF